MYAVLRRFPKNVLSKYAYLSQGAEVGIFVSSCPPSLSPSGYPKLTSKGRGGLRKNTPPRA